MKSALAAVFVLGLIGACRSASSPTQTSPVTQTYVVEGQVKHVGARPFEDDLTVFEAITAAEPLPTSDLEHVKLTRPKETPPLEFVLDLAVMLKTGDSTNNVLIQPGDVIVVPARAGS
jgi:polysaccharide export outer membrane protein